jgi:xanthine dehydrogenase molybdenum-binding subunit
MTKHPEDQTERMLELIENLNSDKYKPKEYKYIGQRVPRKIDGPAKASGLADYTMDIQLPGMLYMRFLMSPYPHAKILKMDTAKAEKLPGVRYVLRYDDPDCLKAEIIGKTAGFLWFDRPLVGVAHMEGELVGAAVAADTEDIAEEALSLIEIEWEERPFLLDPVAACEPGAVLVYPERFPDGNHWNSGVLNAIEEGDVKKGFAEADKVFEFRFDRTANTWVGPERPCGVWKWNADCPEIWLKHQRPHLSKSRICDWFGGIPMNKIKIHAPHQGASFGGWAQIDWNLGPLWCAAKAAKMTGRPVKYIFTRREDFFGGASDEGAYFVKVGFKNDGTVTAVDSTHYGSCQIWPVFYPGLHLHDNTRIPNIKTETKSVWLNKGHTVPTRCEQLPPSTIQTLVFDRVAAELGMDPTEVALKNDGAKGHDTDWLNAQKKERGFQVLDSLKECIDKGKAAIKWNEKRHKPGANKLPNGRMHGMGFGWDHEWGDSSGSAEFAIRIERTDGTASLLSAGSDNGVDAENSYCQVAADELGFRLEDVHYDSHDYPGFYRMTPDSSTNMSETGWAVRHAARILKQKILESATSPSSPSQRGSFRPAFPDTKPEDLDIRDSVIFSKADPSKRMSVADFVRMAGEHGCMATDEYFGERLAWSEPLFAFGYHAQYGGNASATPSNPRPRFCRQSHFMEIEVDTETGEIFVIKIVNVNDVGKVINRMSAEGQQYGGSIMGVSRARFEEVIHDPVTGVMLNGNLIDYKIATIKDLGPIDTILVETELGFGPYGLCGIGEDIATAMPGLMAPAVYNAIGKWIYDYPITPDKILKALGKA